MASESILKSVTYIIMALKTKNSAIVYGILIFKKTTVAVKDLLLYSL
jgi:hypothetical protein